MKARVIETNEIVELQEDMNSDYFTKDGLHFKGFELDFNVEQPDYWEKLKHQYAGMAMQGILANCNHQLWERETNSEGMAKRSYEIATALVNKLKEESQCKE